MTPSQVPPLLHRSQARSFRAALVLAGVWLVLLILWSELDAAPWIIALLFLPSLPAAYEFAVDKQVWFELTDNLMRWQSGNRRGDIAIDKVEAVRLKTRLDLSVRVQILAGGKRIILPQDCVPPHQDLEKALQARGIQVTRHHFGI
ncbi:hypothetical protein [uncultured Pelagimonas sp.]|uniref:hypothetical protein n=1 Tax=uncultured Pelagimonas sp. TaxID=1618102 RepID=UPI002608F62D|nr:hypothetical protein [uncultured Pelagimonas sp.]